MLHLFKLAQRLSADTLRRRKRRGKLRVCRLQLLQTAELAVILIVLHRRRVEHIVKAVCLLQLTRQLLNFLLWIHGSSSKPKYAAGTCPTITVSATRTLESTETSWLPSTVISEMVTLISK